MDNNDTTRRFAATAAKTAARVIKGTTPGGPVESSAFAGSTANLAPIAAVALVPMGIVAAPVALAVGLIALLVGGATVAARKSER